MLNVRECDDIIQNEKKFCCFLSSNPTAQERNAFFDSLSSYKHVDSGGAIKNNIGYRVTDKIPWLKEYKFSIAFENSQHPGYTTEKLPHALIANTIPIYWGNPQVDKDFNPKAFINCHDYESFDDVIEVVKEIDQNNTLYFKYLRESYFRSEIENEFCREDAIFAKFEHIFSKGELFISSRTKKLQKKLYLPLILKRKILRAIWFLKSRKK